MKASKLSKGQTARFAEIDRLRKVNAELVLVAAQAERVLDLTFDERVALAHAARAALAKATQS